MQRFLLLTLLYCLALPVSAQPAFSVFEASLEDLRQALQTGQVTSVDLVQAYISRIEAYDQRGPALNSVLRINPRAIERAEELDRERAAGEIRGPLHGIPILVKDNYNTTFMPTTGSSVALADFTPSANATQVDLLLAAGAIVLAKTTLHEFAAGITTVASLHGQTRNPYDPRRVPGGSSGGTGAAVAASFGAFGLGSDTCGSIRIPSAFNNLVGLRPSKGLSSIYGVMPLSHTQDVAGPLARSLDDLAIALDVTAGYDPLDPATAVMGSRPAPGFVEALASVDPASLRLGRLTAYLEQADSATRELVEAALQWYADQGATVIDVDIPELSDLLSESGLIGHEFRVDLNQYLTQFHSPDMSNLAEIVDSGLFHTAIEGSMTGRRAEFRDERAYAAAVAKRIEVRAAVENLMEAQNLDAIAYPTIGRLPVFIGTGQSGSNCSLAANSGLPALSFPVGFADSGLPVGIELLGGFLQDARLLAIAYPFEQQLRPRRAPSTTPELVDGRAPSVLAWPVEIVAGNLRVSGEMRLDRLRNVLDYDLTATVGPGDQLHAAVLVINRGDENPQDDPIVHNLLRPSAPTAVGSYPLSPAAREAFSEGRLLLRLFGSGLGVRGSSHVLQP